MKKQVNPEAAGYLLEAKACEKVVKELTRLEEKYKRKIVQERAKRQAELETAMGFSSEKDILDAYGWELITEKQYDLYLKLFREGESALENQAPTSTELAHSILCRLIAAVDGDRREWEFSALTPEQQQQRRKEAEKNQLEWKKKIAEIKRRMDGSGQ